MSWQIYPTASSDDSFNISVEFGLVTLVVNTVIISGQEPSGSSAHAIYATHCAAVLGIICSLPKVSNTYSHHTHQKWSFQILQLFTIHALKSATKTKSDTLTQRMKVKSKETNLFNIASNHKHKTIW